VAADLSGNGPGRASRRHGARGAGWRSWRTATACGKVGRQHERTAGQSKGSHHGGGKKRFHQHDSVTAFATGRRVRPGLKPEMASDAVESRDIGENHCGTCTMCCKVLGVHEIDSPAGQWCPHCAVGVGCSVYASRPHSCRTYSCIWRQWRAEGQPVSDSLRPDRCRVVVDAALNGVDHYVRPDPQRPLAWRTQEIKNLIQGVAAQTGGEVWLVVGVDRKRLILW